MKIKDLVNEGPTWDKIKSGVSSAVDDFKSGYQTVTSPFSSVKQTTKKIAKPTAKKSPFDNVDPRDMKEIISSVLNKQELNSEQLAILKKLYNRL